MRCRGRHRDGGGVAEFRHPPALDDRQPQGLEELDDPGIDRRGPAGGEGAAVEPDQGEDLGLDLLRQRPDGLRRLVGHRRPQPRVELLPDPGDGDQRGRVHLGGDGEDLLAVRAVGERDRVEHRRPVVGVAAGDVRHRQEGDQHAGAFGAEPGLEREQPERRGLGVADVLLREHGGLGGAGGA